MTELTMPRLTDSMEEGTILSWLKSDGDAVASGEDLVEIETEKATVTWQSPGAGVLDILAPEGTTLAVGAPMGTLGIGVDVPAGRPAAVTAAPDGARPPAAPQHAAPRRSADAASAHNGGAGAPVRATPLARRLAAGHGVDLGSITGSGPRGRVVRQDVVAAASLALPSPVPQAGRPPGGGSSRPQTDSPRATSAVEPATGGARGVSTRQELTRVEQVIARRMASTKATVPDFQVQTEAALDELLALRLQLKAVVERAPSVNDFVIKAAGLALRDFPLANGSFEDGGLQLHSRVNVGVAVAAERALFVPTVTDADTRSLGAIASEVRRLAAAVREGTITPPELTGATFTVSNLGMYGMTAITPVINAPQAAILGVGAARNVLARVDGEVVERHLMTLTLSCDHRILYGAEASRFLSRIRDLLEQPLLLAF